MQTKVCSSQFPLIQYKTPTDILPSAFSFLIIAFLVVRGFIGGFSVSVNLLPIFANVLIFLTLVWFKRLIIKENKQFKGKTVLYTFIAFLEYLYFTSFIAMFIVLAQYGAVWGRELIFNDHLLLKLDAIFIGFNWYKFNALIVSSSFLSTAVILLYDALSALPFILIFSLIVFKKEEEIIRFLLFMIITGAITVFVFYLYPVVGPVTPNMHIKTLINFSYLPTIEAASSKIGTYLFGIHSLDGFRQAYARQNVFYMTGAICLPSYHAVEAAGFAYFMKNTNKTLFYTSIILSILICIAAIPMGNHYLVDIVAGGIVSLVGFYLIPRLDSLTVLNNLAKSLKI